MLCFLICFVYLKQHKYCTNYYIYLNAVPSKMIAYRHLKSYAIQNFENKEKRLTTSTNIEALMLISGKY